MLTSQQLEAGAEDFTGSFGDGTGKWKLSVQADVPIRVMSFLASSTGHITNVSTMRRAGLHGSISFIRNIALDGYFDVYLYDDEDIVWVATNYTSDRSVNRTIRNECKTLFPYPLSNYQSEYCETPIIFEDGEIGYGDPIQYHNFRYCGAVAYCKTNWLLYRDLQHANGSWGFGYGLSVRSAESNAIRDCRLKLEETCELEDEAGSVDIEDNTKGCRIVYNQIMTGNNGERASACNSNVDPSNNNNPSITTSQHTDNYTCCPNPLYPNALVDRPGENNVSMANNPSTILTK